MKIETQKTYYWNGHLPSRHCLMVQPGEYYMITAGTAQYKNGLSFAELQSIFANLGCTYARSMDGGGSSSLVVNGKLLNTPAQYDERPVVDFLSFLP